MEHAKPVLYVVLSVLGVLFLASWTAAFHRAGVEGDARAAKPTPWGLLVGFVTDFFDTLGIGSFATTTSLFRARREVDDRLLPGTLNVGHTLPTIAQAYIFIDAVDVQPTTLVSMIAAAVAGGWFGAGIVSGWARRRVQGVMGAALLVIGSIIVFRLLVDTDTGVALELTGWRLAVGLAVNLVLGLLMTMGVGLYAPCLVLVWLLGMSPRTGFPIMMGSCAFLMPLASIRFLRDKACDLRASAALTLTGLPAVVIAGLIVKSMPLDWLKWLVVGVVLYTAVSLLLVARRSAAAERRPA